ncbi:UDP-N-acetylmuramoyl-tripeptide--D-alanyl-D-alanine ligase [bacterium]|nr:UDP-N-acetylmuramoyl-tripeptide--D-alanyl-D-alanine ligase [bacterium]
MNFWNEEKLKEAIGNNIKTYNFPEDWSSSGLAIWHKSCDFKKGNIILMREAKEARGVLLSHLPKLVDECSAIMTTKAVNYFKYNKPIIELKRNIGEEIINMARYIRKIYTGKVIAITGSSGKSTTTKLIADILSSKYKTNSNIESKTNTTWGISWNMTQFDINSDYWIIETSLGGGMNRNSAITKPDCAIITNVAPVHLAGDMQLKDIAEEKSRIFNSMHDGQTAILYNEMNYFEVVLEAAKSKNLKVITFGENEQADIRIICDDEHKFIIKGQEYNLNKTVGKHIMLDMAAAIAVALEENFKMEEILEILKNFKTLEGRGEDFDFVFENGKKVTVVDESYNANPLSMNAAITAFGKNFPDRNKILILGDMAECGTESERYHREISIPVDNIHPTKVLLCGKEIMALYEEIKDRYETKIYDNVMTLYAELPEILADGDCIMLKASHSTNLHKIIEKMKENG